MNSPYYTNISKRIIKTIPKKFDQLRVFLFNITNFRRVSTRHDKTVLREKGRVASQTRIPTLIERST